MCPRPQTQQTDKQDFCNRAGHSEQTREAGKTRWKDLLETVISLHLWQAAKWRPNAPSGQSQRASFQSSVFSVQRVATNCKLQTQNCKLHGPTGAEAEWKSEEVEEVEDWKSKEVEET